MLVVEGVFLALLWPLSTVGRCDNCVTLALLPCVFVVSLSACCITNTAGRPWLRTICVISVKCSASTYITIVVEIAIILTC